MKNKVLFALALAVAANAFIATPALAFDWTKAKKAAFTTGKTALGIVALGTSIFALVQLGAIVGPLIEAKSFLDLEDTSLDYAGLLNPKKLVGAMALALSVGAISGYACYRALKSAWND
jgi:hypothetical protein